MFVCLLAHLELSFLQLCLDLGLDGLHMLMEVLHGYSSHVFDGSGNCLGYRPMGMGTKVSKVGGDPCCFASRVIAYLLHKWEVCGPLVGVFAAHAAQNLPEDPILDLHLSLTLWVVSRAHLEGGALEHAYMLPEVRSELGVAV